MPVISKRKRNQIQAYRNKYDICKLCGRFENGKVHVCYENYVKSDMRGRELNPEDVINTYNEDVDTTIEEIVETPQNAIPELDKRIKTIQSYRLKKNLCIRCGKDIHEGDDCEEDYTGQSDLRPDEDKEEDPRTINTPKTKITTIAEEIKNEEVNKEFLSSDVDQFFNIKPTSEINPLLPFIMIDINKSEFGQCIGFDYLSFMASKYKRMIIYILGDPKKEYTLLDNQKLIKFINVCPLKTTSDQIIVNHICSCKRFFGFPSKYITYCMINNVNSTAFLNNIEGFDLPCNIVNVFDDENVTLDIIKRDVLSWRI